MTENEAMQIKDRHSEELLKIPGVHGVGVGQDEQGWPVLLIMAEIGRYPDLAAQLAQRLEGIPFKVVEGGPIHTLPVA